MKYKIGDIIEKMDGNIAKVYRIWPNRTYYVGFQDKYWYIRGDQIKSLCARPENKPKYTNFTRFEIMDI